MHLLRRLSSLSANYRQVYRLDVHCPLGHSWMWIAWGDWSGNTGPEPGHHTGTLTMKAGLGPGTTARRARVGRQQQSGGATLILSGQNCTGDAKKFWNPGGVFRKG